MALWGAGAGLVPWASAQSLAPAQPEAAAFERALQQADGPRRRILEAARAKAAPPPSPATVVPRPRAEAASYAVLAAIPAPLAAPAETLSVIGVAALPVPEPVKATPALIELPVLAPLALVSMVQPDVPERWLKRVLEVPVDLVVRRDGSVDEVAVQGAVPQAVAERVIEAVRQWRYAPQPLARPHRVTLVLKPG